MNNAFGITKTRPSGTEILYFIFFIGLICAFRAVTSIGIALMIVAGLNEGKWKFKSLLNNTPQNHFIWGCILFFLLQTGSLFYTTDLYEGLSNIQKKSGLLFTPLAIVFLNDIDSEKSRRLFSTYCIFIFIAALFLLCVGVFQYIQYKTISAFFYHELVAPFRYHAVYVSILVFISLAILLEFFFTKNYIRNKSLHVSLILFLSIFLVLLSSKLVISFYFIYLLYLLINRGSKNQLSRLFTYTTAILLVFSTAFILLTKNPVSNRFRDFTNGHINLVMQDRFSQSTYFNGLQFRLLQWRLVPEILNENHCWWTGLSAGDAQAFLNKKYIALNMFQGDRPRQGHGYLDYNAHNELLQSLLETGIPGAMIFVFICVALIRLALQAKKRLLSVTSILLLIYLFVESLFNEQYGIVIFTFWPLFIAQYYNPVYKSDLIKERFEKTV